MPSSDPGASPGSRIASCPGAEFAKEDERSREVFGRVRSGEELVAGALVQLDRTSGGPGNAALPLTTTTDPVGFFSGLLAAPLRYDIAARFDSTLIVYRDISARYFEPGIDTPTQSFGRMWTGNVDVAFDRVVAPDHSVAFFASGDGVWFVSGDVQSGLAVLADKYTTIATLHAVEYETAAGLAKATAYGKTTVALDVGKRQFARFALAPVERFVSTKFIANRPAGFLPASIDVLVSFSATSNARLVTVPDGGALPFPVLPNASYAFRATAARADGSLSDTGELGMSPDWPEVAFPMYAAPAAVSPANGDTRAAGEILTAAGEGVFEHMLVSQTDGSTMRIVTSDTDAMLPDLRAYGSPLPAGPYTWTVRSYPTAERSEELGGLRARRYRPMTTSAPRTLTLTVP